MKRYLVILIISALFGPGCSGTGADSDFGIIKDTNRDIGVVFPDHGNIADEREIQDTEDTTPQEEDYGRDTSEHEVTPGTKGWPCTKNEDCFSGFCLPTPEGRQCTNLCSGDTDCDAGASCVQASQSSDLIYVCVYRYPDLCLPCVNDADCKEQMVPGDTLCVAWVAAVDDQGKETGAFLPGYGVEGAYCGGPCKEDGDCPRDYVCRIAYSTGGSRARQCVLQRGSCGCNQKATDALMQGACFVKNSEGTCQGTHRCTPTGLTGCDAMVPSPEKCNGIDDNCNGKTDEDYQAHECELKNQYGTCKGSSVCKSGKEKCVGQAAKPEQCDGKDDNCNGMTDEEGAAGCKTFYLDHDKDGYGLSGDHRCLCKAAGEYTAVKPDDCNDRDPAIHPGASEICNSIDDDCDGVTDPVGAKGCKDYYKDVDKDGHGEKGGTSKCLCVPIKPFVVTSHDDCDDLNPKINPGMKEKCNGIDDNCDGITDPEGAEGCQVFHYDFDQDGWGDDSHPTKCLCRPGDVALYTALKGGDCDDHDNKRSPGLDEKCGDDIDNNCNGLTDEDGADGCVWRYIDHDNDGWGGKGRCMCTPAAPYTCTKGGDCNDDNKDINPGEDEICGNSVDENCNGSTNDPGAIGCKAYYLDHDNDGYGTDQEKCLCLPKGEYRATKKGDCNDDDPLINPGEDEICGNLVDENCNGSTDEPGAKGCTDYYYDGDGDGWGSEKVKPVCLCAATADFHVTRGGDCDDADKDVHPGAVEICDHKDNDCKPNTPADPEGALGCKPYYPDADKDGYGNKNAGPRCLCGPDAATGFTTLDHTDCNDHDKNVNPGEKEKCNAGTDTDPLIDENCNGLTDEEGALGCKTYYFDNDGDGEGIVDDLHKARCLCHPDKANKYTALNSNDCNDKNNKIGKGFPEYCDDIDNNCNGLTDEAGAVDGTDYYFDSDGDGFGSGKPQRLCGPDYADKFTSKYGDDCDDGNAAIYPDSPGHPGGSICGIDANCDGKPKDPGEQCDDGNAVDWDGCTRCKLTETRINQVTQKDQDAPSVSAWGNGTFIAAWESMSADPSGYGITARRFDSSMKMLSDDLVVNTTQSGNQQNPSVAVLADDSAVVAWQSYGHDGDGWGVYAQLLYVNTSGKLEKSGNEFLVNQTVNKDQQAPEAASCGNSGWVSAYISNASGTPTVMVRRFKGAVAKTDPVNPDQTVRAASHPDIAWISNDQVVVVWEANVGTNGSDCFARVLTLPNLSQTAARPDAFRVNQVTNGYQTSPRVAALAGGGFVVTWVSVGQDGDGAGVIARRYGANLLPKSGDIIVNSTIAGDQLQPDVAPAGQGFFIVWTSDGQDASGYGVFGRRYDATGTRVGKEIDQNVFVSGTQWQPRIAGGTSLVMPVWSSSAQDGDGMGIFGRPNVF